jgi:hypothetical protein
VALEGLRRGPRRLGGLASTSATSRATASSSPQTCWRRAATPGSSSSGAVGEPDPVSGLPTTAWSGRIEAVRYAARRTASRVQDHRRRRRLSFATGGGGASHDEPPPARSGTGLPDLVQRPGGG